MDEKVRLLKDEGLTDDEITVTKDRIVETEDGFISYRMENGLPYITHAMVYPASRKSWVWLDIVNRFEQEIASEGHELYIAEVIGKKGFFRKMLRFLGADRPYAVVGGASYYLVRCGYGIRRLRRFQAAEASV